MRIVELFDCCVVFGVVKWCVFICGISFKNVYDVLFVKFINIEIELKIVCEFREKD